MEHLRRAAPALARAWRAAAAPSGRTVAGPTGRAAASGVLGLAAGALGLAGPAVFLDGRGYEAPPRFTGCFAALPPGRPRDKAGELAWAVKHLEVETVRGVLEQWPKGAELVDAEQNTLFHLVAAEPARCAARPEDAEEVLRLLLRSGWAVVDHKDRQGERADALARRLGSAAGVALERRSRDFREKLRIEEPLALVGEQAPRPWQWDYPLQDEQRRAWAGVAKSAFRPETCRAWMDALLTQGQWSQLPDVPRKVAWYVSEDFADCPYRYSGLEYDAVVFPPFMQEIRAALCEVCGIPPEEYPNSCNINVYADNRQEVGWHSDDEVLFQGLCQDTRIISLSLGSARDFCWRLQGTTDTLGCAPLGDGDIMTMEGLFQKHYKHAVPVSDAPAGTRINLTFRWIRAKAHAVDVATKSAAL